MNNELRGLIVEQRIDEKSNGVKNPDAFARFVFDNIEKRGKMSLSELMKELDLVIAEYKKGEKVD